MYDFKALKAIFRWLVKTGELYKSDVTGSDWVSTLSKKERTFVIRTNAGARLPTYAFRLHDTAWAERNGGKLNVGAKKEYKTLRRGRWVRASQRKKEPRERREAEKAGESTKVCPSSFPVLSRTSSKWANGRSVKSLTLAGGVLRAHICGARAFASQGPQKTKAFETHLLTPPWPAAPSWDEH